MPKYTPLRAGRGYLSSGMRKAKKKGGGLPGLSSLARKIRREEGPSGGTKGTKKMPKKMSYDRKMPKRGKPPGSKKRRGVRSFTPGGKDDPGGEKPSRIYKMPTMKVTAGKKARAAAGRKAVSAYKKKAAKELAAAGRRAGKSLPTGTRFKRAKKKGARKAAKKQRSKAFFSVR